jgi:hypothetical protein
MYAEIDLVAYFDTYDAAALEEPKPRMSTIYESPVTDNQIDFANACGR